MSTLMGKQEMLGMLDKIAHKLGCSKDYFIIHSGSAMLLYDIKKETEGLNITIDVKFKDTFFNVFSKDIFEIKPSSMKELGIDIKDKELKASLEMPIVTILGNFAEVYFCDTEVFKKYKSKWDGTKLFKQVDGFTVDDLLFIYRYKKELSLNKHQIDRGIIYEAASKRLGKNKALDYDSLTIVVSELILNDRMFEQGRIIDYLDSGV